MVCCYQCRNSMRGLDYVRSLHNEVGLFLLRSVYFIMRLRSVVLRDFLLYKSSLEPPSDTDTCMHSGVNRSTQIGQPLDK